MVTRNQIGFLDESGDAGRDFTKPNVSSHFIVGCVLVSETRVESIQKQIEDIARQYFSGGEIKSSNIGKNDERRLKILKEMVEIDFQLFAVVVDKRALKGEGFKYKESFHKYLNNLAYQELYRVFPRIKLYADEHGGKEFMEGYVKYVKVKNLATDPVGYSDFAFEASTTSRLIQLADFMAGTLGRCYDANTPSPHATHFLAILSNHKKLFPFVEFPRRQVRFANLSDTTGQDPLDNVIEEVSLRLAGQFLENAKNNDDEFIREQVASLEFMMFNALYGETTRYISTTEFLSNLARYPNMQIQNKQFGRNVIGRLKDGNVLIASNTKGYKLILNRSDLNSTVKYIEHFVGPMLRRLKITRDRVRLATMNQLDPLDSPEFQYLKKFYDS